MSEWRISNTYAGGERFHQVYRLRNVNAVDHAGNREVYGTYQTMDEAIRICKALNAGEISEGER